MRRILCFRPTHPTHRRSRAGNPPAIVAQSDGGIPTPASYEHVAGETLFSPAAWRLFEIAGRRRSTWPIRCRRSMRKASRLSSCTRTSLVTEVAPQDKEWMPKIETKCKIPPLVASGTYKIVVKAEDVLAKTTAELACR